MQLIKSSFGKKRALTPKAFYNPVPPSKRLVEHCEHERFRKDLEAVELACDKFGNVQRYGSSTWLTALQTDSDSSSESEDEAHEESDSCDDEVTEPGAEYVPTVATRLLNQLCDCSRNCEPIPSTKPLEIHSTKCNLLNEGTKVLNPQRNKLYRKFQSSKSKC